MTPAPRGYAALIAVLVLSAVLTTLAFSAAMEASMVRLSALMREFSTEARMYADACIRGAVLQYAEGVSLDTLSEQTITLSPAITCTIDSVTEDDHAITIRAHARSGTSLSLREGTATVATSTPRNLEIHDVKN